MGEVGCRSEALVAIVHQLGTSVFVMVCTCIFELNTSRTQTVVGAGAAGTLIVTAISTVLLWNAMH